MQQMRGRAIRVSPGSWVKKTARELNPLIPIGPGAGLVTLGHDAVRLTGALVLVEARALRYGQEGWSQAVCHEASTLNPVDALLPGIASAEPRVAVPPSGQCGKSGAGTEIPDTLYPGCR